MVVKAVESLLLVPLQPLEEERLLGSDARMIKAALLAVLHKQNIVDERKEAIAQMSCIVDAVAFFVEVGLYGTLGGKLGAQAPNIVVRVGEESALHPLLLFAEDAPQDVVTNERLRHEVALEAQTKAVDFVFAHGQSRRELPQQALHTVGGDFPNAEETENVVDAVGREVLRHVGETTLPPQIAILAHGLPVVGGEAPVLPIGREGIGWRTGLSVQIEIERFYPCFHRVARNADGDVALQDDAVLAGIATHS